MRRIENIHLRASADQRTCLLQELVSALAKARSTPHLVSAEVFRHATVETDLAVRLHFDGPGSPHERSDLAERIAAALREHGSVKLSTWVRAEDTEAGRADRKKH